MMILTEADKRFCKPCIYRSRYTGAHDNLCDFILRTGKPRGCPPGVGCTARRYPGERVRKEKLRVCDTCGVRYEGGKHSRLCPDCRTAIRRQTALNMVAKREKKTP